jgi:hypothetical protein
MALHGVLDDGSWWAYALDNTPEQRFMGTWRDGVHVTHFKINHGLSTLP